MADDLTKVEYPYLTPDGVKIESKEQRQQYFDGQKLKIEDAVIGAETDILDRLQRIEEKLDKAIYGK